MLFYPRMLQQHNLSTTSADQVTENNTSVVGSEGIEALLNDIGDNSTTSPEILEAVEETLPDDWEQIFPNAE